MSVDLATIARDLKITPEKVDKTVQLLDDGNTIPFITRFRKDETGGLNEKQIQAIKQFVHRKRTLQERKEFILKSIESQGKLTDELKADIGKANTARYLEDLYLPFKPKKQSLAMTARQQGLEPLATEIFEGKSPEVDLAARATDYVRVDKGLASVDDVIAGVGYLIAERFSENRQLRSELRKIVWNTGQMVSKSVETKSESNDDSNAEPDVPVSTAIPAAAATEPTPPAQTVIEPAAAAESSEAAVPKTPAAEVTPSQAESTTTDTSQSQSDESESTTTTPVESASSSTQAVVSDAVVGEEKAKESTETSAAPPVENQIPEANAIAESSGGEATSNVATAKKKKKKKKKKAAPDPFKDYIDFKQPLKNLPHHRVLAINRGERAGKLKVRIDVDQALVKAKTTSIVVPDGHPSTAFMEKCAQEAVSKSVIPSLEREARRELTEAAEKHAVEVFASNLKNLLLQPPIHHRRILAVDPGFKRGCTVAAIDETGNLLETGQIFVVGNQKRREESADKLHKWIEKHGIHTIAIGNGAACRETEQMVSDLLGSKLADSQVNYIILNEAGASIYSTSEIGREELPDLSPNERSAVSIGRRLLDPLSELVKISPANIGVGMYQHDVKAKHLSESLDEVVQFCVNRVGVNVNTASPSLLKYVSGLNQLTARRIFERRHEKGVFKNRQQLKEVTGLGDATFVQAAGFMRIHDGDELLDATSIHPESYDIAKQILSKIGACPEKLFTKPRAVEIPTPPKATDTFASPVAEPVTIEQPTPETTSAEESSPEVTSPGALSLEASADEASANDVSANELSAKELSAKETEPAVPTDTTEDSSAPSASQDVIATGVESPVIQDGSSTVGETTGEKPNQETTTAPIPHKTHVREKRERDPERAAMLAKLKELKIEDLAKEFSVGNLLIRDIVKTFSQPRRDPRDGVSKPIFRSGIIKTDDLKVEMQLDAQVVNVVDFGVFVDIGLGESSLIHVSQLSNRFIRNPHQFFSIGDVVKVWVTEIDSDRRRVKLTAIKPGTPKFDPSKSRHRRGKKSERPKSERARGDKSKSNRGKFKGSGGQRGKPAHARTERARRRPPKPVKPITEEMLEGKEPMRSFSDLLQFVEKKPSAGAEKKDES